MSTISAIVTPQTAAGIGIVRLSGEDAIKIADKVFKCVSGKKIEEKNNTIQEQNDKIEDRLNVLSPRSITNCEAITLIVHCQLSIVN